MHRAGPGGGVRMHGSGGGGMRGPGGGRGWHSGGWHGGGRHGSSVVVVGPYWGPYWGWGYPYYYPPYAYYPPAYYEQGPPYPDAQSEYVEREPDAADESRPRAGSYWYYCPSAHGYYPDVRKCSKNWIKVPARPAYEYEEDR